MASKGEVHDHKTPASSRAAASSAVGPGTPRSRTFASTPTFSTRRNVSSGNYSASSRDFHPDEDVLVVEFGSRYCRVGFEGESAPRCVFDFAPDNQRRPGDYRKWQEVNTKTKKVTRTLSTWGRNHELWRMDLRGFDPGVVEDKVERTLREAHEKYLMIEGRPSRVAVIAPADLPHPLLSSILNSLFQNFNYPGITLLSTPVMNTAAAGVRSALVVDIGWAETVITGIYEYRQLKSSRSVRAMKLVTFEMGRMLNEKLQESQGITPEEKHEEKIEENNEESDESDEDSKDEDSYEDGIGFADIEDITERVAWCRSFEDARAASAQVSSKEDTPFSIEFPSDTLSNKLALPFFALSFPVETALFAKRPSARDFDDHEKPLHLLVYEALLSLPIDVRAVCMSHIIITGGGSNVPGVKTRIFEEVNNLIKERGWDPIVGSAVDAVRQRKVEAGTRAVEQALQEHGSVPKLSAAADVPNEPDPILANLSSKSAPPSQIPPGTLRVLTTLGPWQGGSLVTSLGSRGVVNVEGEKFMATGIAGASRDMIVSMLPTKRQSYLHITKEELSALQKWTLGAWA